MDDKFVCLEEDRIIDKLEKKKLKTSEELSKKRRHVDKVRLDRIIKISESFINECKATLENNLISNGISSGYSSEAERERNFNAAKTLKNKEIKEIEKSNEFLFEMCNLNNSEHSVDGIDESEKSYVDDLRDDFNSLSSKYDFLSDFVLERSEEFDSYAKSSIDQIKEIPLKIAEIVNSSLMKIISSLKEEVKDLKEKTNSPFNEEIKNLKEEVNLIKNSLYDSSSRISYSRPTTSYSEESTVAQSSIGGYFDSFSTSPNKNFPSDGKDQIILNQQNNKDSNFNRRSISESINFNFNIQTRVSELEERIKKIENNAVERKNANKKFIDLKEFSLFKELVIGNKENLPGEEDTKLASSLDGNTIEKFFNKLAKSGIPGSSHYYENTNKGFKNYTFSKRVIEEERSLKEWCESDFKLAGSSTSNSTYNNNFFPKDLEKTFSFKSDKYNPKVSNNCKDLYLGTGAGKTTTVVRCVAFHNKQEGVTVVVPNRSLVGSFVTSHNDWLSKGKDLSKDDNGNLIDDPKKRVTVCQICYENHAKNPYQVVHNGKADLINVFTWNELMEAFALNREIIKGIIIFDEAHVTDIWYKKTIDYFIKLNNAFFNSEKKYMYKIIRTSATFQNLPSSSRLTGTISDYYVNPFSIAKFCHSNEEFLSKKIIVFCSQPDHLDFKVLDDNNIDYLVLNEGLERYATQIVQTTKAKLIIADSSYSLGFNFGDVNVISTGISSRKFIKRIKNLSSSEASDEFVFEKQPVVSEFSDLIQERGRCAREKNHSGIWVSFLPENFKEINKNENGKIEAEKMFKAFSKIFKNKIDCLSDLDKGEKGNANEKILKAFGSYHFNKKELNDQDRKKSHIYLRDIFLKTLCDDFLKKTFFSSKNISSEKERVLETEFIFENDLISVISDQIKSKSDRMNYYERIIRFSSWEMIKKQFEVEYPWARARRTKFEESDEDYENCFKFYDVKDAEIASFIVSLRDSKNCYKIFEEKAQKNKRSLIKIVLDKKFIDKNKQNVLKSFDEN